MDDIEKLNKSRTMILPTKSITTTIDMNLLNLNVKCIYFYNNKRQPKIGSRNSSYSL